MSLISPILERATAMLKWLDQPDTMVFRGFIEDWLKIKRSNLENTDDRDEMLRTQGAIEILKRISGLRVEILQYQEGVRQGKYTKLESSK